MNNIVIENLIREIKAMGIKEYHWSKDFRPWREEDAPIERGGVSFIWQKRWRVSGGRETKMVAVKVVDSDWREAALAKEERTVQMCKYLLREFRVWKEIQPHPNISRLMGVVTEVEENEFPGFMMPWYEKSSLRRYLEVRSEAQNPLPLANCLKLLRDVANGLTFLHNNSIVHRDLKGRNVLVDENEVAYLSDFGNSKFVEFDLQDVSYSSSFVNTLHWTPPEYVTKYGRATEQYHNPTIFGDMWSFGCTFHEVLRIQDPYYPNDPTRYLAEGTPPPEPTIHETVFITPTYRNFMMNCCWKRNPPERIRANVAVDMIDVFIQNLSRSSSTTNSS